MPKHALGSGPQGLRRPRFSFFRFTFQTAREPGGSHPRSAGDMNSRRSSLASDELIGSWVTVSSEVLRQARHHAEAVRRAEWGVYIRGPNSCQHDYT